MFPACPACPEEWWILQTDQVTTQRSYYQNSLQLSSLTTMSKYLIQQAGSKIDLFLHSVTVYTEGQRPLITTEPSFVSAGTHMYGVNATAVKHAYQMTFICHSNLSLALKKQTSGMWKVSYQ